MALTQGLQLPFGIQPVNALLVDSYAGPYNSVAEALSSIPSALRVQTRFVNIIDSGVGKLYWFKDGIADGDLVEFSSASGTVTSVGLSMPSAFSVANSPVTSSGTLTVTGAGLASQYVRGDGTLGDFPSTTGGGSSVSYYLNGSVNQGTFGGNTYYEMNKTPILGTGTDFSTSSDGYIASFITDVGDPNKLLIPAGNWNLELYFSASSGGGNPSFYVELYKYNGTTFTLIASSSAAPELISLGTSINPYFAALAVPETPLALTDRLALRVYVTTSGRTITLHTEDNHLCQIITTFSTGLTALNGLTAQVQYLTTGTSGTDFNIASSSDTHTFNIPVASATNTGKLSSTDWSTFNSKEPAIAAGTTLQYFRGDKTFQTLNTSVVPESGNLYFTNSRARSAISLTTIGTSGVATYDSGTGVLNIPQYQAALTNPVTGTGTTNYLPKFTGTSAIGDSQVFDNGTNVGIGTTSPSRLLHISSTGDTYLRVDGQGFESLFGSDANGTVINQTGLTGISLRTANSDRMRITAGGRILMGTTSDNGTDRLQVSGSANFSSSVTASSFSGAGTGLTGTASSLSIGGNAATATTATNWAGSSALGSYAYRSSGLAELSGATFTGVLQVGGASNYLSLNNVGYVRADATGNTLDLQVGSGGLRVMNSSYSSTLLSITNAGAATFSSSVTANLFIGEFYSSTLHAGINFPSGNTFAVRTGNQDNRLVISSTGAATFTGNVSIASQLVTISGSDINLGYRLQGSASGQTQWLVGASGTGGIINGGFFVRNESSSTTPFVVTSSGNVGIGTTSPSTALHVVGSGLFSQDATVRRYLDIGTAGTSVNSYVRVSDGSVIAKVQSIGGSNVVYFGSESNHDLSFITNNSIRATISSTGAATFTGDIQVGNNTSARKITINGGTAGSSYPELVFYGATSDHSWTLRGNHSTDFTIGKGVFGAYGSTLFTLTSSGNVGIGTTSPNRLLEVVASSGAVQGLANNTVGGGSGIMYGRLAFYSTAFSNAYIDYGAEIRGYSEEGVDRSNLRFYTSFSATTTERMRITSAGNVGIGTTSPNSNANRATLTLQGAWGGQVDINVGSTNHAQFGTDNFNSGLSCRIQSQDGIVFYGSGSERMRITSAGNVGIGTTSPSSSASIPLTLNATGTNIGTQILFTNSYATAYCGISADTRGDVTFQVDGTGSGSDKGIKLNTNGNNTRLYVTNGGEVYIAGLADQGAYNLQVNGTGVWAAGAYVNGSDQRLKENIQDIDKGLEYINKVRPVKFNYKRDYSRDRNVHTGFIAQQLQSVFANEDYLGGMVQEGAHLNVAYQNLIPIMVKAIQEQQIEIENLKAQSK